MASAGGCAAFTSLRDMSLHRNRVVASAGGCAAFTSLRDMSLHRYGCAAASLAYTDGSPVGRVLKRLCTHRYCAGMRRTSSSIQRFMRAVSASASSLGKSLHGSRKRTR